MPHTLGVVRIYHGCRSIVDSEELPRATTTPLTALSLLLRTANQRALLCEDRMILAIVFESGIFTFKNTIAIVILTWARHISMG